MVQQDILMNNRILAGQYIIDSLWYKLLEKDIQLT